ncbi:hypothetical protein J6590_035090 [Homalodisca vitripennis]|nr:hypothetical protein J6590_035090 [Homalodisca vitripennis]
MYTLSTSFRETAVRRERVLQYVCESSSSRLDLYRLHRLESILDSLSDEVGGLLDHQQVNTKRYDEELFMNWSRRTVHELVMKNCA